MRTWSAEELFVRAYSAAAVGVQRVLDAGAALERITRPLGHDVDCVACAATDGMSHAGCADHEGAVFDAQLGGVHVADGAEQLAEAEERDEVWEASDAYHEALYANCDDGAACLGCGRYFKHTDDCPGDSIQAVQAKADRRDAEMWRATVGATPPGYHRHQAIPDHNGYCKVGVGGGELCHLHESHQIHVASPADAVSTGDGGEAVSAEPPSAPASPPLPFDWDKWVTPAFYTALTGHRYSLPMCACECQFEDDDRPVIDEQGWREHVTPYLIDAVKTAIDVAAQAEKTTKGTLK